MSVVPPYGPASRALAAEERAGELRAREREEAFRTINVLEVQRSRDDEKLDKADFLEMAANGLATLKRLSVWSLLGYGIGTIVGLCIHPAAVLLWQFGAAGASIFAFLDLMGLLPLPRTEERCIDRARRQYYRDYIDRETLDLKIRNCVERRRRRG